MKTKCPRRNCHGTMRPGQAIEETLTGIPDFLGSGVVCTVSPGGPGRLVRCLKCDKCGHSMTIGEEK